MTTRFCTFASLLLALVVLTSACGEEEPELTIEERLATVYGRTLSETEVADKLATADMLCQLDDRVLDGVWRQLNERQLNYQDVVFGQVCPERSIFYAGLTGRYVTEEARESGVAPSTTRPPLTTATTAADATTTVSTVGGSPATLGSETTDVAAEEPDSDQTGTTIETEDPATTVTTLAATTTEPRATIGPAPTEDTPPPGEGG